jgi:hypothetical protein
MRRYRAFGIVCLTAALVGHTPAIAQTRRTAIRFHMWNSSEHVIQEVYVSPASDQRWGKNLLKHAVAPGQKFALAIPGGCGTYDVRFVAPDGIEYIQDAVHFCEDDDVVRISKRTLRRMKAAEAAAVEAAEAK